VIVDTHVHVISDDQQKYPRRADADESVRDTSGETLLALNREAGVDRTVLVFVALAAPASQRLPDFE
jgi:predicted TIM-barrel fold metal-dependent hydrolase